jgi:hypothetical protein
VEVLIYRVCEFRKSSILVLLIARLTLQGLIVTRDQVHTKESSVHQVLTSRRCQFSWKWLSFPITILNIQATKDPSMLQSRSRSSQSPTAYTNKQHRGSSSPLQARPTATNLESPNCTGLTDLQCKAIGDPQNPQRRLSSQKTSTKGLTFTPPSKCRPIFKGDYTSN